MKAYDIFRFTTAETFEINENDYCHVILSSLAPFSYMYYQLVITLNKLCAEKSEFTIKDILISMQQLNENLMHQQQKQPKTINSVHPYCLALENLNIALYAFTQAGYLHKIKGSNNHNNACGDNGGNGAITKYLEMQLLEYCQLLPFKRYFVIETNEQQSGNAIAKL